MSDNQADPSGDTEAFRAFTQKAAEERPGSSRIPLIVGLVVVVAVAALVIWAVV